MCDVVLHVCLRLISVPLTPYLRASHALPQCLSTLLSLHNLYFSFLIHPCCPSLPGAALPRPGPPLPTRSRPSPPGAAPPADHHSRSIITHHQHGLGGHQLIIRPSVKLPGLTTPPVLLGPSPTTRLTQSTSRFTEPNQTFLNPTGPSRTTSLLKGLTTPRSLTETHTRHHTDYSFAS